MYIGIFEPSEDKFTPIKVEPMSKGFITGYNHDSENKVFIDSDQFIKLVNRLQFHATTVTALELYLFYNDSIFRIDKLLNITSHKNGFTCSILFFADVNDLDFVHRMYSKHKFVREWFGVRSGPRIQLNREIYHHNTMYLINTKLFLLNETKTIYDTVTLENHYVYSLVSYDDSSVDNNFINSIKSVYEISIDRVFESEIRQLVGDIKYICCANNKIHITFDRTAPMPTTLTKLDNFQKETILKMLRQNDPKLENYIKQLIIECS